MPSRPILPRPWSRWAVAASLLLGLLASVPAFAHAILEESVPPEGGSVPAGRIGIMLRYNSRLEGYQVKLDKDWLETAPTIEAGSNWTDADHERSRDRYDAAPQWPVI